ncbi:MAG: hypothetical protein MJB14_14260 [Spirochaetes bacterium]|nr:hypothetical protein [Spirochaetota bacterium]
MSDGYTILLKLEIIMKINENDVINYLKDISLKNELIQKAAQCCLEYVKNWKIDDPDEYKHWFGYVKEEELSIEFKSHSFIFDNNHVDYVYIITTCEVFIDPHFRAVNYNFVSRLDGEIIDDYMT